RERARPAGSRPPGSDRGALPGTSRSADNRKAASPPARRGEARRRAGAADTAGGHHSQETSGRAPAPRRAALRVPWVLIEARSLGAGLRRSPLLSTPSRRWVEAISESLAPGSIQPHQPGQPALAGRIGNLSAQTRAGPSLATIDMIPWIGH